MSLEDTWYLCNDSGWLKHAAELYEAGECLVQLRIMSLAKQMEGLLMEVRTAERTNVDTNQLAIDYTELMKQKQLLQTKLGRLNFISTMLETAYINWKKEREDILPL